jgi:hypothetical protein
MFRVLFVSVGDNFDENDGTSADGEWIFDFEIKNSHSHSRYIKINDLS